MSGECEKCGNHTLECNCKNNMEDEFGGIDPPAELPERKIINVKGREEHEAMLRDTPKMISLGLDPAFEKIIYLSRWGS